MAAQPSDTQVRGHLYTHHTQRKTPPLYPPGYLHTLVVHAACWLPGQRHWSHTWCEVVTAMADPSGLRALTAARKLVLAGYGLPAQLMPLGTHWWCSKHAGKVAGRHTSRHFLIYICICICI
jgi:hypothetical protein